MESHAYQAWSRPLTRAPNRDHYTRTARRNKNNTYQYVKFIHVSTGLKQSWHKCCIFCAACLVEWIYNCNAPLYTRKYRRKPKERTSLLCNTVFHSLCNNVFHSLCLILRQDSRPGSDWRAQRWYQNRRHSNFQLAELKMGLWGWCNIDHERRFMRKVRTV